MRSRQSGSTVRRGLVAVIAATGLVTGLAACGGSDAGSEPSAARTGDDFKGETLTVNTYGGSWKASWDKAVIEPFEKKYNAKVRQVELITGPMVANLRANKANPQVDVWTMAAQGAAQAASEGLSEPLDSARIPNLEDLRPEARHDGDLYADFISAAAAIGYNKDKVKTAPDSWSDLTDPKYKGRVIMPDNTSCCGYFYPLAMASLNGGGVDNMGPGWEALETLKPNVLTFSSAWDQLMSMLASGQADVGLISQDRGGSAAKSGAPIGLAFPKEATVMFTNGIGISKGTKHKELAEKFVDFALSAEAQTEHANNAILLPMNTKATVSPENQQYLPDEAAQETAIKINWDEWNKVQADWATQWDKIIGG
jgi:putative spermidine/putrescine transport system substrate-binding protein